MAKYKVNWVTWENDTIPHENKKIFATFDKAKDFCDNKLSIDLGEAFSLTLNGKELYNDEMED